jgi:hypothetical protein
MKWKSRRSVEAKTTTHRALKIFDPQTLVRLGAWEI